MPIQALKFERKIERQQVLSSRTVRYRARRKIATQRSASVSLTLQAAH
jgi:hypothetical protein